jgi:hypothetical protein
MDFETGHAEHALTRGRAALDSDAIDRVTIRTKLAMPAIQIVCRMIDIKSAAEVKSQTDRTVIDRTNLISSAR